MQRVGKTDDFPKINQFFCTMAYNTCDTYVRYFMVYIHVPEDPSPHGVISVSARECIYHTNWKSLPRIFFSMKMWNALRNEAFFH